MSEIPPDSTAYTPPFSPESGSYEGEKDLAIVAMTLGLIGLIPFLGVMPAIIGAILGMVAVAKNRPGRGLAIAAIVIGALAFLLGLWLLVDVHHGIKIDPKGTTVKLLQYKMNKHAGETISGKDELLAVEIDSQLARGLKSVMADDERDTVIGHKLGRGVAAGDWVMLDDFWVEPINRFHLPSDEGLITIPIDPMYCPGKMLHLGDRVNVLGEVQIKPGQFKTVRLIDGLIVRSIGGKSVGDLDPRELSSGKYGEIGSSLPKDMVTQWYNVLSYVKERRAILEIRNPRDPVPKELEFGPEVKDKVDKAGPAHGDFTPSSSSSPMAPPL